MGFTLAESGIRHEEIPPRRLLEMNIGAAYAGARLEDVSEPARRVITTWLGAIPTAIHDGDGFLFEGEYRSGKTAAAAIMLRELARHGGDGHMIRALDIPAVFINGHEDAGLLRRILTVDLLVIDDVGEGLTPGQQPFIERLVRNRYDHKRPIVFTANSMDVVLSALGEGLSKVIGETCYTVKFPKTNLWFDKGKDARHQRYNEA